MRREHGPASAPSVGAAAAVRPGTPTPHHGPARWGPAGSGFAGRVRQSWVMDWGAHLWREVRGFEAAARRAVGAEVAPAVPSCPGWSVSDLVAHLGWVHRYVTHIVTNRCVLPPDVADVPVVDLPADRAGWPVLGRLGADAGAQVPVPVSLVDWFWAGAAGLVSLFADTDPEVGVWTSRERSVGF